MMYTLNFWLFWSSTGIQHRRALDITGFEEQVTVKNMKRLMVSLVILVATGLNLKSNVFLVIFTASLLYVTAITYANCEADPTDVFIFMIL